MRGSALDQLQFLDAQHAWAAGETQYPLSRDPFFLVTTDGGRFWRQKPVVDDGGPGAIQSFRFDSPQHGELVVETGKEYAQFESQTGGESWTMRAKVKTLPKIRGVAAEAAVRVKITGDGTAWAASGSRWRRFCWNRRCAGSRRRRISSEALSGSGDLPQSVHFHRR
jgi:photosystem II stability/assembly factor-like uncharacterized protein